MQCNSCQYVRKWRHLARLERNEPCKVGFPGLKSYNPVLEILFQFRFRLNLNFYSIFHYSLNHFTEEVSAVKSVTCIPNKWVSMRNLREL